MVDAGKLLKMEVDYSSTCDEKIPECEKMAKSGQLNEAIEALLSLEKQTRTGSDMVSTSRVLVAIVQLCFEAGRWDLLNEHVVVLSRRRSQLKQAVAKMVQKCVEYVDKTPDKPTMIKLIDTLRTVTEGKIYVEVERARLTHKLARMREDEGEISKAADIIQELQVETYGSMEKKEKVELILEQMRLCLAKKDYIRTQIISKKISPKFFDDESTQELKLKYYKLMIELDGHEGSFLATCRHFRSILTTPVVKDDSAERDLTLQSIVLYLLLAPYDNEQADLTHRVLEDPLLDHVPHYKGLLKLFNTPELINWKGLCSEYERGLTSRDKLIAPPDIFDPTTPKGQSRWKDLRSRVVEHNIRIMAKYYTKISLTRMAELMDLTIEETERVLSSLVENGTVKAKTDRPAGVVSFAGSQDPTDVLNTWSTRINDLMTLVNKTTHLINREEMVHKHLMVGSATTAAPTAQHQDYEIAD
ncbi:26S proteasome non-ATPase regulatory subunit 12 [Cloeon dipterum]|uniref:26S proteasome non-ATPase regulatory subunit 12 n=1 Tax=Cloeon dipterum TaxID=197152 RepID=UPI0032200B74